MQGALRGNQSPIGGQAGIQLHLRGTGFQQLLHPLVHPSPHTLFGPPIKYCPFLASTFPRSQSNTLIQQFFPLAHCEVAAILLKLALDLASSWMAQPSPSHSVGTWNPEVLIWETEAQPGVKP